MNKQEKKRLAAVIRATEYLFLENISLKLVLEHRAVPNWQQLLERLLSDKEMLAGVRLNFETSIRNLRNRRIPQALWMHSWENFLHRKKRISSKRTREPAAS